MAQFEHFSVSDCVHVIVSAGINSSGEHYDEFDQLYHACRWIITIKQKVPIYVPTGNPDYYKFFLPSDSPDSELFNFNSDQLFFSSIDRVIKFCCPSKFSLFAMSNFIHPDFDIEEFSARVEHLFDTKQQTLNYLEQLRLPISDQDLELVEDVASAGLFNEGLPRMVKRRYCEYNYRISAFIDECFDFFVTFHIFDAVNDWNTFVYNVPTFFCDIEKNNFWNKAIDAFTLRVHDRLAGQREVDNLFI